MFEPGDIVECVDAGPFAPSGRVRVHMPCPYALGGIYVIERFWPAGSKPRFTEDGVWIAGDVQEWRVVPGARSAVRATRFRLLKRRDPDLIRKLMSEPILEDA